MYCHACINTLRCQAPLPRMVLQSWLLQQAGLLARAKRSRIAARAQPSHGRKFEYSMQKDSHADYEFINEVGCLDCVEIDEQLRSMSSFREFSKHRFSKR